MFHTEGDFITNLYQHGLLHILERIVFCLPRVDLVTSQQVSPGNFGCADLPRYLCGCVHNKLQALNTKTTNLSLNSTSKPYYYNTDFGDPKVSARHPKVDRDPPVEKHWSRPVVTVALLPQTCMRDT